MEEETSMEKINSSNQNHCATDDCDSKATALDQPEHPPHTEQTQHAEPQPGHKLRLAMGLAATQRATETAKPGPAMPSDPQAIASRLKSLGRDITCNTADQLELLVRYDELEGWKSSGVRHCVAWMNLELDISMALGWEYLRVGRELRALPVTTGLFRSGALGWSKIRLITRVANSDNEAILCHSALDASVSGVERLCNEYRWQEDDDKDDGDDAADAENKRSIQQWETRSFRWRGESNGNTLFQISLPPEQAAAFLNSVNHSFAQLEKDEGEEDAEGEGSEEKAQTSASQKRADAAVLMAETSIQAAGRDIAAADRYQVIVSVDESVIAAQPAVQNAAPQKTTTQNSAPQKRASLNGISHIAHETARRIACDCSVTTLKFSHGEPLDIGRKSRIWTAAMERVIKSRDQHCQFPGCTASHQLQIHHIDHWGDGGSTCVDNGVCLCAYHHMLVHEGGYRIERVNNQPDVIDEQFMRHATANKLACETENQLRTSRASFDEVRKLSPTRYRFRVVDKPGVDINAPHSTRVEHGAGKIHQVADAPGSYVITLATRHPTMQPSHHIYNDIGAFVP